MSSHTAIATVSKGQIDAIKVPSEAPGDGEVLLKVEYSSLIAFDTYMSDLGYAVAEYPVILGFNASGVIAEVGAGVDDLAMGDRVTAFSFVSSRSKGMQEYCIQPRTTCSKIPDTVPLEAAVSIPDNFVTAFYTLFNQLSLPIPSSFPATAIPELATTPILIYGAGSTAGQYAIQLLQAAGYKNIIATASAKHHDYLRSLGATSTFDYNSPNLVQDIAAVVGGDGKVTLGVDCITAESTMASISKIMSPKGTLAILLPVKEGGTLTVDSEEKMHMELPERLNPFPKGTKVVGVRTFLYQEDKFLKENLMSKILPTLLGLGIIKPNRVRLMDQGDFKERVAAGLELLRNNKVSAEKVVVRVCG